MPASNMPTAEVPIDASLVRALLAEQMPDLYEVFAAFYRQDPAARVRRYIDRVVAANPAAAAAMANRPRIVVRYAKPAVN